MDARTFGMFVSRCRGRQCMTQAQLAMRINVTDKAVSRWERGVGLPDISMLIPLADALGVSIQELMTSDMDKSMSAFPFHIRSWHDLYKRVYASETFYGRVYVRDISVLPKEMHEHVENGGILWMADDPVDGVALVCTEKHGDGGIFIDAANLMTDVSISYDMMAELPEPFKSYVAGGGKMYTVGAPKNGHILISCGLEPDAYTVPVEYHDISEYLAEMSLRDVMNEMKERIKKIKDKSLSDEERICACDKLYNYLVYCRSVKELDKLTEIYWDKKEDNAIQFDPSAVTHFMNAFMKMMEEDKESE